MTKGNRVTILDIETQDKLKLFAADTLTWYSLNGRKLPWRETTNSYYILLSEFMLQQTQVSRVITKYEEFVCRFPKIIDLANAPLANVIQLWVGLGYNRRAKFLQESAKAIVQKHNSQVPQTENELLALPGIGPYVANAILAFAFHKPVVVIDANIKNVMNKVFGLTIQEIPSALEFCMTHTIGGEKTADFYNALMDIANEYYTKNANYATYPYKSYCKWLNGDSIPELKKYKQSKFLHSNRWYRGQILKELSLRDSIQMTRFSELEKDESEKYYAALLQLKSEQLVIEENGKIYLPK